MASYNGIWLPLKVESAECLAKTYELHAQPRIDITRAIMLDTLDFGDINIRFPHIFALQCQGWFDICATSELSLVIRDCAPDVWAGCRDLIQDRLSPSEASEIERRYISSGKEAVERTLAWLTNSSNWKLVGNQVDGWIAHQTALARAVLDCEVRANDRKSAIESLLVALYGDVPFARKLATVSFLELTHKIPGLRNGFERALCETERVASFSDFLEQHASKLKVGDLELFCRSNFGWDVRHASKEGAT
jgi:hypothetical protein